MFHNAQTDVAGSHAATRPGGGAPPSPPPGRNADTAADQDAAGAGKLSAMRSFEDRVVAVVAALRPGDVVTYGEVAREAGSPGAARAVGNVLARTGVELPWWRVVQASGRLATGKEADQARRLRAEGVTVRNHRVTFPPP